MLDIQSRRKACEDTLQRIPAIVASTHVQDGHPLDSAFVPAQLPPLQRTNPLYPDLTLGPITIHNSDAFALARALDPAISSRGSVNNSSNARHGKVGVLNLASDLEPGGGWRYTLSKTQEEALCYSSTLFATLKPEWYPFPNTGAGSCAGIISPSVVVFKDTLDRDLIDLPSEQQHVVTVITVAAPCHPKVTDDGDDFADPSQLHDLREKILSILRLAATYGTTRLVLGAMGCGAYGCPPRAVAREMRCAIEMEEFKGWFETIVFAVYAIGPSGKHNFDVFSKEFAGTA